MVTLTNSEKWSLVRHNHAVQLSVDLSRMMKRVQFTQNQPAANFIVCSAAVSQMIQEYVD